MAEGTEIGSDWPGSSPDEKPTTACIGIGVATDTRDETYFDVPIVGGSAEPFRYGRTRAMTISARISTMIKNSISSVRLAELSSYSAE
jgi:hypothetical protein